MSVEMGDVRKKNSSNEMPSDFETAIEATGYGKFNIALLLIAIPCCTSSIFSTSAMSYILPSAECDLNLSLLNKGMLNAVTYAGMVSSAFMWGYLADTLGRKKLLLYGFLLDFFTFLACAISQNFIMIMSFKFIEGFMICGPFAVLMSYLCECHSIKYRSRVMMALGIFFSISNILISALAWIVIPQSWEVKLTDYSFILHSWQIFLIICTAPSFLSFILLLHMPESPKFLMSRGRNDEALAVFQFIYKVNHKNSSEKYPITSLVNELEVVPDEGCKSETICATKIVPKAKGFRAFQSGLSQVTPMFRKPHVSSCILVFSIQFGLLFGLNTLRLWLPQLFTLVSDFENGNMFTEDADLCDMIQYNIENLAARLQNGNTTCTVVVHDEMYINTIIIGVSGVFSYLIAGSLINALGGKTILIYGLITASGFGMSLYFAYNSLTTLILSTIYVNICSIASTALVNVVVSLFPTSLRTMTVSLLMMFGRLGALIGNMIFPFLLSLGCFPPFILIGSIVGVCGLMCIFLPETKKKPLE